MKITVMFGRTRPHMLNVTDVDNALITTSDTVYNLETCFSLLDKPAVHSCPVRMKGIFSELYEHPTVCVNDVQ